MCHLKEEPPSLELGWWHWKEPGLIFTQTSSDWVTVIKIFSEHKSFGTINAFHLFLKSKLLPMAHRQDPVWSGPCLPHLNSCLSLSSSFIHLQPYWPPCCSLSLPRMLLPECLCTCYFPAWYASLPALPMAVLFSTFRFQLKCHNLREAFPNTASKVALFTLWLIIPFYFFIKLFTLWNYLFATCSLSIAPARL